ncbi:uncharacterized membrane protein YhaH (DUF805 family) [Pectinatus brassicae]|uniref:Uncharacterized membrane protein YhaH (DUF805 family) n=1 Tax=Pectinatus brassicae TaxID=862415 RepID=A0A840UX29_9FIRM|nr:DUF805 domain-containing protein [Pectinatus brassicae]MBB5337423.1 uncharacterized membrane protein YhaH (DUF805 family) [Pectinatus brassicae]
MTFPEALRTCIKEKYATFNGRASRSEFWFFELFIWILTLINGKAFIYSVDNFFMEIISGIISIALLALFVPIVAVAIRRLHDIGKSGWYLLSAMGFCADYWLDSSYLLAGTALGRWRKQIWRYA